MPHLQLAILVAAVLAVRGCGATSREVLQDPAATVSGTAMVMVYDIEGSDQLTFLSVKTAAGNLVQVEHDPSQLSGIHSGMAIQVTGHWQHPAATPSANTLQEARSSSRPTFRATAIQAAPAAGAAEVPKLASAPSLSAGDSSGSIVDAVSAAAAAKPRSSGSAMYTSNKLVAQLLNVVFIPSAALTPAGAACAGTTKPTQTVQDIKKTVFAESNPKGATVGSAFNQCSFGKTRMPAERGAVTDIVRLPCSGTMAGRPWNWSTCNPEDLSAWAEATEAQLRRNNFPLSKYRYRVHMLPPNACRFAGASFVGCAKGAGVSCRAWISNAAWTLPNTVFHELGHLLYLGHATTPKPDGTLDTYGDASCSMGSCCTLRCYNTPHAWQLGWATLRQLDGASLAPGQTLELSMPSLAASPRTGLRIVPSWVAGEPPIYVGYRTQEGGDAGLGEGNHRKVFVHTSAIANSFDASVTILNATLAVKHAWHHARAGLVVRYRGISEKQAVVSVCRSAGAETAASCAAGQDNDCNGLAGAKEPACDTFLRKKKVRRPSFRLQRHGL